MIDRILVINLARSALRREGMRAQLQQTSLNWSFLDAIDGEVLNLAVLKSAGRLGWNDWCNRDLTSGEVGCLLSHRAAWASVRSGERVLVLEDDITLTSYLERYLREIGQQLEDVCHGAWDMIHLWSQFPVGSGRGPDLGRRRLSPNIWSASDEYGGAVAYALTRPIAERLLQESEHIRYAADGYTNHAAAWGFRAFVANPFIGRTGEFRSDIGYRSGTPRPGDV